MFVIARPDEERKGTFVYGKDQAEYFIMIIFDEESIERFNRHKIS